MSGNTIDVKHVAELARLQLKEESIEQLQKDMENIVAYIEELNELDVSGIEPTAHAALLTNVYREDVVAEPYGRVMLKNAPELINDEAIKLPRVLPGEGSN